MSKDIKKRIDEVLEGEEAPGGGGEETFGEAVLPVIRSVEKRHGGVCTPEGEDRGITEVYPDLVNLTASDVQSAVSKVREGDPLTPEEEFIFQQFGPGPMEFSSKTDPEMSEIPDEDNDRIKQAIREWSGLDDDTISEVWSLLD